MPSGAKNRSKSVENTSRCPGLRHIARRQPPLELVAVAPVEVLQRLRRSRASRGWRRERPLPGASARRTGAARACECLVRGCGDGGSFSCFATRSMSCRYFSTTFSVSCVVVLVERVDAELDERPRPVDRLGDRRLLLQLELTDRRGSAGRSGRRASPGSSGTRVRMISRSRSDVRVVEVQVQAAALERFRELARRVRRQEHDRGCVARPSSPSRGSSPGSRTAARAGTPRTRTRSGRSRRRAARRGSAERIALQQRTLEQERLVEDRLLDLLPVVLTRLVGLDAQQLLAVVPLVERASLVQTLVALQPDELETRATSRPTSRARSCRHRPDPRGATACRAGRRGRHGRRHRGVGDVASPRADARRDFFHGREPRSGGVP